MSLVTLPVGAAESASIGSGAQTNAFPLGTALLEASGSLSHDVVVGIPVRGLTTTNPSAEDISYLLEIDF